MLGALDGQPATLPSLNVNNPARHVAPEMDNTHQSQGIHKKVTVEIPQGSIDNYGKTKPHNLNGSQKSETDAEITPIPSDANSARSDQPLKLADLNKTELPSKNSHSVLHNVPLLGALSELKSLEVQHNNPHNQGNIGHVGKENVPHFAFQGHMMEGSSGQPFGKAMQMLSKFNQAMGADVKPDSDQIIQLQPEKDYDETIPPSKPPWVRDQESEKSSLPRMPFLQLNNVPQPREQSYNAQISFPDMYSQSYFRPPTNGQMPFPMLRLPPYGTDGPKLVPPQTILEYEESKYGITRNQTPERWEDKQDRNLPLLKADVGPFQIGDDGQSVKR